MRPRTRARPPIPTDAEILAYDNVPVDVAARYLDWPEQTVRLALRETIVHMIRTAVASTIQSEMSDFKTELFN